jgi:hypothetical protein
MGYFFAASIAFGFWIKRFSKGLAARGI